MKTYTLVLTLATAPTLWLASCNGQLWVDDESGEGGAAAVASEGGAAAVPGEGGAAAVAESPRWQGNEPNCPESVPSTYSDCSVSEGQICAYDTPIEGGGSRRSLCACWEQARDLTKWSCYMNASADYTCPSAQPENGSSCVGLFGALCSYPERTTCACSADSGAWTCAPDRADSTQPPPASPDPQKPVNALSPEERVAWCDWLATARLGEGHPEPLPPPVDLSGYAIAEGCTRAVGDPMCSVAIPAIPSSTCQANLALSTCEAPLSELSDCVRTLYDGCWPAPHGCARYFERPGCSGTIAISTRDINGGTGGTAGTSAGIGGAPFAVSCNLRVR